jgi:hypothetical protein
MRTRLTVATVLLATLGMVGCAASSPGKSSVGASTGTPGLAKGTQGTAVASTTLTTPQAVQASDGKWHLAYELVLTNVTPFPLRITDVTVLNGITRHKLLSVSGATLKADFTPIAGPMGDEGVADPTDTGATTMASSSQWIVWLDVVVPSRAAVPPLLEHHVIGSLQVPKHDPQAFDFTVSRIRTNPASATVLTPPVLAGDWYMSEGCCADDTHHRRGLGAVNGALAVPQRFAIDFYKVDAQHRTWIGDPSKLSSYLTYRQPVLAAGPGTVVASRNDLPNNPDLPKPPKNVPLDATVGNFVIEKLDSGLFVLYGHMDPGSVLVQAGQHVAGGSKLGLIGTSGNSTTPHVHFQILTEPTFFPTDSPPYVFSHFNLLGRVPDRIWDDNLGLQPTGKLPFTPASPGGNRVRELPLDRAVVHFN